MSRIQEFEGMITHPTFLSLLSSRRALNATGWILVIKQNKTLLFPYCVADAIEEWDIIIPLNGERHYSGFVRQRENRVLEDLRETLQEEILKEPIKEHERELDEWRAIR